MVGRNKTEDDCLVAECLSGSQQAWGEFYRRFVGLVRSVVNRRLRAYHQDCEDVAQEVFLEVMSALKTFNSDHPLPRFVCVIAERVCIDQYRYQRAAIRDGETLSVNPHNGSEDGMVILQSDSELPDEQLANAQRVHRLRLSFRELSPKCRELLKLRYEEGLPYREIAEILGASENALTVQARRCLDELRAKYTKAQSGRGKRS